MPVTDPAAQEREWRDAALASVMWLRERHRDQVVGGMLGAGPENGRRRRQGRSPSIRDGVDEAADRAGDLARRLRPGRV